MNRRSHWNAIYETKGERDVSWFEEVPSVSLELIEAAGLTQSTCVIDIGGGASRLIDALSAKGVACLTVLDVSAAALRHAQTRMGDEAGSVTWIESDVTGNWSVAPVDIWHDRAVFHFLIEPEDRVRYVSRLRTTLKPDGAAIIATFALDGPPKCSGLPVVRYSPESLLGELGNDFALEQTRSHTHLTPWGATQAFQYSLFRRTR